MIWREKWSTMNDGDIEIVYDSEFEDMPYDEWIEEVRSELAMVENIELNERLERTEKRCRDCSNCSCGRES